MLVWCRRGEDDFSRQNIRKGIENMQTIVINAGSSSVKFTLYDTKARSEAIILDGVVDRINSRHEKCSRKKCSKSKCCRP